MKKLKKEILLISLLKRLLDSPEKSPFTRGRGNGGKEFGELGKREKSNPPPNVLVSLGAFYSTKTQNKEGGNEGRGRGF